MKWQHTKQMKNSRLVHMYICIMHITYLGEEYQEQEGAETTFSLQTAILSSCSFWKSGSQTASWPCISCKAKSLTELKVRTKSIESKKRWISSTILKVHRDKITWIVARYKIRGGTYSPLQLRATFLVSSLERKNKNVVRWWKKCIENGGKVYKGGKGRGWENKRNG